MKSLLRSTLITTIVGLAISLNTFASDQVPIEVRALAWVYVSSQPSASTEDEEWATKEFIRAFFRGFVEPYFPENGNQGPKRLAYAAGHRKGIEYWNAGPETRKRIWISYGYTEVRLRGIWSFGFERSFLAFPPKKMCWLSPQRYAVVGVNRPKSPWENGSANVEVIGCISPSGTYGHIGMARCQIIATSVRGDA